jgi:type IV fimbrial biogenesis protein FimT
VLAFARTIREQVMGKRANNQGYSLIEVMLVLALVGTIPALATSAFTAIVNSSRINSGAEAIFNSLQLTRSEAAKRNSRVVMCKSSTGLECADSGDWHQGWIVFHDANNNGEVDAGEEIVYREAPLGKQLKLSGNGPVKDYVSYSAFGKTKLTSGAFQAGTFTICLQSAGKTDARTVVINSSGRPRMDKVKVAQCV